VTISGMLQSANQKELVSNLAVNVAGVRKLQNRTTILHTGSERLVWSYCAN
jgi:osmotically-inducible protein OsmY